MPRRPQPWYKKSHRAWYVKLDGKQVRLAEAEDDAWKEFHKLMAGRAPAAPPSPSRRRTIDMFEAWFASRVDLSPKTTALNAHFAQGFVDFVGKSSRAADVRPAHVSAWLAGHPGWSKTTRSIAVSTVKAAFRWAAFEEWIPRDPLARMKVPTPEARAPADAATVEVVLSEVSAAALEVFRFMYLTGARPGEAASVESAGVDLASGSVRVVGKMGERIVVAPTAYLDELRRLVEARPEGTLFRNARGGPWTPQALRAQIGRAKARLGVRGKFVPYHLRGIFASERIAAGADSSVVGKMLGHSSPVMLHKHYHNPELATLREAADMKPPAARKKARRKPGG